MRIYRIEAPSHCKECPRLGLSPDQEGLGEAARCVFINHFLKVQQIPQQYSMSTFVYLCQHNLHQKNDPYVIGDDELKKKKSFVFDQICSLSPCKHAENRKEE